MATFGLCIVLYKIDLLMRAHSKLVSGLLCSDVVVNYKVPRLFFAECIGDAHPSLRYLMRGKQKGLERVFKPLLAFKAKLSPPKTICQIWFKTTNKFAKKCLDASSL